MIGFEEAAAAMPDPIWCQAWRDDFDQSASLLDDVELAVPEGDALAERCARYRFPQVATDAIVAERARWDEPRIRRLGAHVQWLQSERYTPQGYLALGWPPPPPACRLLYVYAALGVAAGVEARHRALGIPSDVTAATLWDIGQQVALHQEIHGRPGMTKAFWLAHHLASHLFRLGRLQHQRAWLREARGPIAEGEAVIDVHIPEDGRLSPQACDDSFERARAFFATHHGADAPRYFTCTSWLLDPRLAEILPEESHIVRFQRRFERSWPTPEMSGSVFEFVYYRPDLDRQEAPDVSDLPRRTRVERAIAEHYEAGGRLSATFGWFPIDA